MCILWNVRDSTVWICISRHEIHLEDHPSCKCSDWSAQKLVTAKEWNVDYIRRLQQYSIFLEPCSLEQKEVCESVLKCGSGVLAVGIAGAAKSVALNHIGDILESVFFEPGERATESSWLLRIDMYIYIYIRHSPPRHLPKISSSTSAKNLIMRWPRTTFKRWSRSSTEYMCAF